MPTRQAAIAAHCAPGAAVTLRYAKPAVIGLLGLGLSACSVVPAYQSPHVITPNRYVATPLPATSARTNAKPGETTQHATPGKAPAEWWRNFHSETLDSLIEQGFKQSPTLSASRATLRQFNDLARAAGANYFPTIGAASSTARQRIIEQNTGRPAIYDTFAGELTVGYNPNVFGTLSYTQESTAAQAEQKHYALQAAYETLAGNITTTFLQAASYQTQIDAMQGILHDQRHALKLVKDRYHLGSANYSDVLSERSVVASTEASLAELHQGLATSRHLLATLTGRYPADLQANLPKLDNLSLPTNIPVSLPSQLLQARPDVHAAEATVRATYAQYGLAYAERFPSFALTAAFGRGAPTINDLGNPLFNVWNIALNASATLFDAGALKDKSKAAKAAVEASTASYRNTILQAFQQVADGLRALSNDAAAQRARKTALDAANSALSIVSNEYRLGSVDFETLLNSQIAASQARIAYVQAIEQRYSDIAALYVALGGRAWPTRDSSETSTDLITSTHS